VIFKIYCWEDDRDGDHYTELPEKAPIEGAELKSRIETVSQDVQQQHVQEAYINEDGKPKIRWVKQDKDASESFQKGALNLRREENKWVKERKVSWWEIDIPDLETLAQLTNNRGVVEIGNEGRAIHLGRYIW
jgi:hypothetical protein